MQDQITLLWKDSNPNPELQYKGRITGVSRGISVTRVHGKAIVSIQPVVQNNRVSKSCLVPVDATDAATLTKLGKFFLEQAKKLTEAVSEDLAMPRYAVLTYTAKPFYPSQYFGPFESEQDAYNWISGHVMTEFPETSLEIDKQAHKAYHRQSGVYFEVVLLQEV